MPCEEQRNQKNETKNNIIVFVDDSTTLSFYYSVLVSFKHLQSYLLLFTIYYCY